MVEETLLDGLFVMAVLFGCMYVSYLITRKPGEKFFYED